MDVMERRDYLKTELAIMEGMSISEIQQMTSLALDCATNDAVYGAGDSEYGPDYRRLLINLFTETHEKLPEKGVKACLHLACKMDSKAR